MNGITESDVVGMVMIAVLIALMLIVHVKDLWDKRS